MQRVIWDAAALQEANSENGDLNAVFPVSGGELGALIRVFDWAETSLGPLSG